MLHALAEGETNPSALTALGSPRLRSTPEQLLADALSGCTEMHSTHRLVLKMMLEQRPSGESMKSLTLSGSPPRFRAISRSGRPTSADSGALSLKRTVPFAEGCRLPRTPVAIPSASLLVLLATETKQN